MTGLKLAAVTRSARPGHLGQMPSLVAEALIITNKENNMKRIGIVGSGEMGAAIARLAVAADYEVMIANSRGPESLTDLLEELGPRAQAGDVSAAEEFADVTILAIPLAAYPNLPTNVFTSRTILSTGNYYPFRDGRIASLDAHETTTAEYEQAFLPGTQIVKVFNNMMAGHVPLLANSQPRTALPVAGNDADAKTRVSDIINDLGFDTVDAGTLEESWRFEPESGAYAPIYAASQRSVRGDHLADPASQVTPDRLRKLLAASRRIDVAARRF